MIIIYILIGFFLVSLGNSINEIIMALTEWIKAVVSVHIVRCNSTIMQLNKREEEEHESTRVIGFTISDNEEEEEDVYD